MSSRIPRKKASPRPIARATTSRALVAGQRAYAVLPSAALILGLLGSVALAGCGVDRASADEVRGDEAPRRPHAPAPASSSGEIVESTAPTTAPTPSSTIAGNPEPVDIPPVPAAPKVAPTPKKAHPIPPKKDPVQVDGGLGVVMPRAPREVMA